MFETTTPATELTSQYVAKVTDDLERNAKEQERISAEIASLQEQLAAVQHNHSMLVSVQQALGATKPSTPSTAKAEGAAAPSRKRKAGRSRGGEKGAPKKAGAKKPEGTASGTTRAAQPTLVELIRRHLLELKEPRSAAEISADLGQAHPERQIAVNVVRVTLEGLVAKSQAERTKQGRSVFYTTAAPKRTDAARAEAQPALADH
ncbi:hypothetical protein [Streptomyces chartreusis]|uniref:hypothetical protein n=1 Tax=Streptomyces chartreusis TaxID=1969 RepID=UPI0036C1DAEC